MSLITLSSLERIAASKLAEMLLAANAANTTKAREQEGKIAVVDVRDDGTLRFRLVHGSRQAKRRFRLLIADPKHLYVVATEDHIGGHIRGSLHFPSRSLDATMPTLLRKLENKEVVVFHCALSQQRGPGAALQYLREKEAAGATPGGKTTGTEGEKKLQKVYVLDQGFVGWQEVYGLDERLTEGYRKELWEEY